MKFEELEVLMKDLKQQNVLYRPSSFWDKASESIKTSLETEGIENFRAMKDALYFFVPTYGSPGNSFSDDLSRELKSFLSSIHPDQKKPSLYLEQFLSGYMFAQADYRVFSASNSSELNYDLSKFTESQFGNPIEQFEFDGKFFSRSSLNYLLGLCLLKKHIKGEFPSRVLEVGGGFGTLGEIVIKTIKGAKYIDIDIPPTIFVAQQYLKNVFEKNKISTYHETRSLSRIEIESLQKISCLPTWQIELLDGKVDLFVNFISFQEMEPEIVQNYLKHVKRLKAEWILLRNMKEGKQKKTNENSIGVEIPILSDDYLSMLNEYELVERNVLPFGFKTVDDFHSELLLLRRKG